MSNVYRCVKCNRKVKTNSHKNKQFNLLPIIDRKDHRQETVICRGEISILARNCANNLYFIWRRAYHDNVYQSCFSVTKQLLAIEDYIEEHNSQSGRNVSVANYSRIKSCSMYGSAISERVNMDQLSFHFGIWIMAKYSG